MFAPTIGDSARHETEHDYSESELRLDRLEKLMLEHTVINTSPVRSSEELTNYTHAPWQGNWCHRPAD
jgi:hypothetical protein